jgi:FeS assembly SUF system regulator
MMRVTNLADYAVLLLCRMADSGSKLTSANELSARTGVPIPTVSKILGTLSRAGILNSQRGLKGGFALSRPTSNISVADIVEAVDGPICLTACIDDPNHNCEYEDVCNAQPHWAKINSAVHDALSQMSLADVSKGEARQIPGMSLDGDLEATQ